MSAARAVHINAQWAASARTPVDGKRIFTTTRLARGIRTLPAEVPWPENSWRGGHDAATPPVAERHRTRSSDHVVVLHDPLQSAAPAPPGRLRRPCRCRSLANGTTREHRFTSRALRVTCHQVTCHHQRQHRQRRRFRCYCTSCHCPRRHRCQESSRERQ